MSNNFFYEYGQGSIVDEQGNVTMDLEEEVDPFNLGRKIKILSYFLQPHCTIKGIKGWCIWIYIKWAKYNDIGWYKVPSCWLLHIVPYIGYKVPQLNTIKKR